MDNEKKYKQLHTLISDLYPFMSEYCKEKVEGFFPELAGSKDERIRKALLEMVHDTTGDELWVDYNVHKEEALAWLEKQGEQKPIEWDEYDEMYVSALIAIVRKEDATTQNLRDTLTGWLRCLKGRFKRINYETSGHK